MASELGIAQRYLLPPVQSFWCWHGGGEAITWKGGGTILFRAELVQFLRHLAPERWPRLDSLLLVLAATRDNWEEFPFEVGDSAAWGLSSAEATDVIASLFVDPSGLLKLRELEPELRSSTGAKVVLAEVVLDPVEPAATAEEAAIILRYLEFGVEEVLAEASEASTANRRTSGLTLEDLRRLRRGLDAMDAETLRLRRRTGIDQLPRAADVELSQAQQVRALLGQLQHDDQLRGVARLARELMAAIALPRSISDPDELQVGGVSDITNRGPLDRLLLTELAHDDLTLAVRVSVNEALYLRRESPPRTFERERSVLLETGIRSWGVPRVFATAVALALVATTDPHTRVAAYRAKGSGVVPVDLLSREGLIDHLEALQPESHPGDALQAFAEQLGESGRAAEPLIVTTEDVIADEEFAQALAKAHFATLHLATVNREGDFRLIEKNERGRKQLREARLDLANLFSEEPVRQAPRLIDRDWAKKLPAIFSIAPFPLLLSCSVSNDRMIDLNDRGVLGITKDGRLLHWHRAQSLGAVQLSDEVPVGRLQWSTWEVASESVFAVVSEHGSQALHLLKIGLREQTCEVIALGDVEKTDPIIATHNGVLFVLRKAELLILDIESGETLEKKAIADHLHWKEGRFFRDQQKDQWYAVGYNGRSTRLESVSDNRTDKAAWVFSMFECEGVEGPIGLTRSGDVWYSATGEIWQVDYGQATARSVINALRHGSRVIVKAMNIAESRKEYFLMDVVARTVSSCDIRDAFGLLHPSVRRYITPRNIRHRFWHIAVEPVVEQGRSVEQRRLVLTSGRQTKHAIQQVGSTIPLMRRIRLLPLSATEATSPSARPFQRLEIPEIGFTLKRAAWEDGSEAFLDSRGLLHLRSSDRSVPEVTIVLSDEPLGGWCSDGRLWGAQYYTGNRIDPAGEQDVFDRAIAGFIRRIS